MGMNYILFILSVFMVSVSFAQNSNDDIIVESVGRGSNEMEALMAAKRHAVEKGIGMVLLSQTEIENFLLKRDVVITKTLGAIRQYDILSRSVLSDHDYEIKIKAVVSRTILHEDLAAFHLLLETMEKPKVMVVIQESNVGNSEPRNQAAENAIIALLKKPYDFEMVDPSIVTSIKNSEQKMARLLGDDAVSAAATATIYGAEVIITGEAKSRIIEEASANLGGMKSVQAVVLLRAINCATGRIIATADAQASKVHISQNAAGVQAITAASEKGVKKLLDAIIEDWNKQLNNGVPLMVTVKNVQTFRIKNSVVHTLSSISGVVAVHERSWNGENSILHIDIQYKGNANGFCTKTDGYKMVSGGGSFGVTGQNGTRITLIVQAN